MPSDEQSNWRRKNKAATLSLVTNVVLSVLKVCAAVLTGSISLLSEAVHSTTDIVASVIAFASVRAAAVPPDDEHPFGHGKIESLAGFAESILLYGIVVYIFYEAIPRFSKPSDIQFPLAGIGVMAVSGIFCLVAGRYVARVGKETESLALQSNGLHLTIDSITSAGVLVAIVVSRLPGMKLADPFVACAIAIWIAINAWKTTIHAFHQLIDQRISDDELQLIKDILDGEKEILSYHRLMTRHSGNFHFVEIHVVVPRSFSVVEAHEVADRLEKSIEDALKPAHVVIHVDPLEPSKNTL